VPAELRPGLLALVLMLALGVLVQLASEDGLAGELFLLTFGEDTEYAPGYSSEKFHSIEVGDPERLVLAELGDPLEIVESVERESRVLFFTRSPSSTHYRLRAVRVTNGEVEKVLSEVYVD